MPVPILVGVALEIARLAAPGLIKHLSGSDSAAEVAKTVIETAQVITGTGSPEEALARLKLDPALVLQFNAKALELESNYELALLKDRQDARGRDVEMRKLGFNNQRADAMVFGVVVGLISCLGVLVFYRTEIPGEVVGILSTIAGIFGACLKDAFQFEFGSSRSSRDKDSAIQHLIQQ